VSRWWIDEPVFVGSRNPTTDDLKDLFDVGFRTIISLLDETEQRPNYDVEQTQLIDFQRISIPVRDFTTPTLEQFQNFLKAVNEALEKGKVVIHCQGGSGRTGTMAAAYWIEKGLSAKDTIDRVRKPRPHVVETKEQEDSVYDLEAFITGEGGFTGRRLKGLGSCKPQSSEMRL